MSYTFRSHRSRSPEFAFLGFLYLQPNHGYELHRLLFTELGQAWHVSQSQTYSILKRLESQGFISSTTVNQEKLPPLRFLKITRTGHKRFKTWLETPTGCTVRAIRLEFITRLYFTQKLAPKKTKMLLDSQAAEIQIMLLRLKSIWTALPDSQKLNRLSLQLRIKQLGSILDWLNECHEAF